MISPAVQKLRDTFEREGPRAAIAFLNSLTNHRFTSAFRFDDQMLKSIYFYDREFPEKQECDEIPVLASYCVFVRDSGITFQTHDAPCDTRLDGHPKQQTIQSYCGVPLVGPSGLMFGTACHFDFKPGKVSNTEVELLEELGQLLSHAAA